MRISPTNYGTGEEVYEEYGMPMIRANFGVDEHKDCVGFVGGSCQKDI
jgi:hypothetical protein